MNELSLFSGAGGGLLASRLLGWRTIGYVENNDYCQRVLAARIQDGHLDNAPIFGDIRAFIDEGWPAIYEGVVDVVSAGFPCPPFSVAGKQKAGADPRNMWPQTAAVIGLVRPRYAFLENVPGLLSGSHGYFGTVLSDLAEIGYDARWCVLSAADYGAPHLRKRLWVVAANAIGERGWSQQVRQSWRGDSTESRDDGQTGPVADSDQQRCQREPGRTQRRRPPENQPGAGGEVPDAPQHGRGPGRPGGSSGVDPGLCDPTCNMANPDNINRGGGAIGKDGPEIGDRSWWGAEPDVGRVVDGCPSRVDRLRSLGNMQVPRVAATAWRLLTSKE